MKAPDIIYMPPHEIRDRGEFLAIECKNDIPYIRKEKLLEWAKERLHHYTQHDDDAVCWGQRNAFQQVIDKINSL